MSEKFPQSEALKEKPKANEYRLENGVVVTLDESAQVGRLPSDRDPSLNYDEPENEKFEIIVPVTRFDANSDVPLLREGQWLNYSLKVEMDNGTPRVFASSMIDNRSFGSENPVHYQIHQDELDRLLETEIVAEAIEHIQNSSG